MRILLQGIYLVNFNGEMVNVQLIRYYGLVVFGVVISGCGYC